MFKMMKKYVKNTFILFSPSIS